MILHTPLFIGWLSSSGGHYSAGMRANLKHGACADVTFSLENGLFPASPKKNAQVLEYCIGIHDSDSEASEHPPDRKVFGPTHRNSTLSDWVVIQ